MCTGASPGSAGQTLASAKSAGGSCSSATLRTTVSAALGNRGLYPAHGRAARARGGGGGAPRGAGEGRGRAGQGGGAARRAAAGEGGRRRARPEARGARAGVQPCLPLRSPGRSSLCPTYACLACAGGLLLGMQSVSEKQRPLKGKCRTFDSPCGIGRGHTEKHALCRPLRRRPRRTRASGAALARRRPRWPPSRTAALRPRGAAGAGSPLCRCWRCRAARHPAGAHHHHSHSLIHTA